MRSTIRVLLAAGTALALAGTLTVPAQAQTRPAAARASGTLALNQLVSLQLGGSEQGQTEKRYSIVLQAGGGVIIDLTSVDSAMGSQGMDGPPERPPLELVLYAPDGSIVKKIPNSAGPDSELMPRVASLEQQIGGDGLRLAYLPTVSGTYQVGVRYASDRAGGFELLARAREIPAPQMVGPIQIGKSADGVLAEDGVAIYTVRATAAGTIVIKLESTDFDPVVELRGPGTGPNSPLLGRNDDGEDGTNSYLRAYLPYPGTYYIVARPLQTGGGNYHLIVEQDNRPRLVAQTLRVGQTVEGSFDGQNQSTFEGPLSGYYKLYTLHGEPGQVVTIEMRSKTDPQLDPILFVGVNTSVSDPTTPPDDRFAMVAQNDDTDGLNARVQIRFDEAGEVIIRAGVLNRPESGDYVLSATLATPPSN